MDLSNYRKQYRKDSLRRSTLSSDPFAQFRQWLDDVIDSGAPDPNAMVLATVGAAGVPAQRVVLLKQFDDQGFRFYTNTESQKAQDIEANSHVCLHFPWYFMERQVKIMGKAQLLSREVVSDYFHSRPRDSQLGAWASHQSQPVASREALLEQFHQKQEEYREVDIPLPDFWGGYNVVPEKIEFWQGGEDRLHDRFEFTKAGDAGWDIQRLSP